MKNIIENIAFVNWFKEKEKDIEKIYEFLFYNNFYFRNKNNYIYIYWWFKEKITEKKYDLFDLQKIFRLSLEQAKSLLLVYKTILDLVAVEKEIDTYIYKWNIKQKWYNLIFKKENEIILDNKNLLVFDISKKDKVNKTFIVKKKMKVYYKDENRKKYIMMLFYWILEKKIDLDKFHYLLFRISNI